MEDRLSKRPLLFTPAAYADAGRRRQLLGVDAPAYTARLDGWRDADGETLAIGGRVAGATLDGIVVPVSPEQLQRADRATAKSGLKRSIAMVDVDGGTRTWAFIYTRG